MREPGASGGLRASVKILALSSGLSAAFGFGTLTYAARTLGEQSYASFAVVWGTFFAFAGLLSGVQQETTRSLGSVKGQARSGTRPVTGAAMLGLIVAVGAATLALSQPVSVTNGLASDAALVPGVLALTIYVSVCGALAGAGLWRSLAALVAVEALARLVLALMLLSAVGDDAHVWIIVAAPPAVAMAWLAPRRTRSAILQRGDSTIFRFMRRASAASVTTSCSALIMAGLPALVAWTAHGSLGPGSGALLACAVLTRAPAQILLNGLRLRLVAHFLASGPPRARGKAQALWILATTVVLGAFAGALGPAVSRLVLGPKFAGEPIWFVCFFVSSIFVGGLTVLGVALVASDMHYWSVAGWVIAALVTIAVLSLPVGLESRLMSATLLGPVLGCLVHLYALSGARTLAPDAR